MISYRPLYWLENEQQKLLASDGAEADSFGKSVAICGDTAVIGADYGDENAYNSGSAYIFRFDGSSWVEETKLFASDGEEYDYFGNSVAIFGDTAVIGAHWDDGKGSAYIFRFDGIDWIEEAKLIASDGEINDSFACSAAVFGDSVLVGAYCADPNGINSGAAYVYRFNGSNWVEEDKLVAPDGASGEYFGNSVAIYDDTIVIGAYQDDDNGNNSGSAYIFRFDGSNWNKEAKLTASDSASYDFFGNSVAVFNDTVVVGAYDDDDNGNSSGSAYVFQWDGSNWNEKTKLLASDGAASERFGISVAVISNTAVIGAYQDDDNGNNSGSAYIFGFDGVNWTQEAKLTPSDGAEDDDFGFSVAISGDTTIVGSRGDDDNGFASGSAYIFEGLICPEADLNGDCFVDLEDVAVVASQWLSGKQ
jgi:hypothetical protein